MATYSTVPTGDFDQLAFEITRANRHYARYHFYVDNTYGARRRRNFAPQFEAEPTLNNPFVEWTLSHPLLQLERAVLYRGLSFAFLQQRHVWMGRVLEATWDTLLVRIGELQAGVEHSFLAIPAPPFRPSPLDVMKPDRALLDPPPFAGAIEDPAILAMRAEAVARELSAYLSGQCGDSVARLLALMLPTSLLDSWSITGSTLKIILRDDASVLVRSVPAGGIGAAKGAKFYFQDTIAATVMAGGQLTFLNGCIAASKGPINVAIQSVAVPIDNRYIMINGKRIRAEKLLTTLEDLTEI